jgi:hypothetical protein
MTASDTPAESAVTRLRLAIDYLRGLQDVAQPTQQPELASAGVARSDEVAEWFRKRLLAAPGTYPQTLLFLVGAPGNGKSAVSAAIRHGLESADPSRDASLHYRLYRFRSSEGNSLLVVNDATMRRAMSPGAARPSLRADIRSCLEEGINLQANVNRGIVFDELVDREDGTESDSHAAHVLRWIHNPDEVDQNGPIAADRERQHALRTAVMKSSGVQLVAVYMDYYSLFEEQPSIESEDLTTLPKYGSKYQLQPLNFDTRASWSYWNKTPAGGFVQKVSTYIKGCELSQEDLRRDPLRANLESLTSERFACGLLASLRAFELVTAHKVPYRRLIGVLGAAVATKSRGQEQADEHPCDWVQRLSQTTDDKRKELENFIDLGNSRSHQVLFGILSNPMRAGRSPQSEVVRGSPLTAVDPVCDAVHGDFKLTDIDSGWARPITNAFQTAGLTDIEADSLLSLVCEDPLVGSDFVTPFEEELDRVITGCVGGGADGLLPAEERSRVLAWYHDYLCRLYALSHGIYAHRVWLHRYVQTWNTLSRAADFTRLDNDLEKRLSELILPKVRTGDGTGIGPYRYLTVLTPRTAAIEEFGAKSQVVAKMEGLRVMGRTLGDFIELRLAVGDNGGSHTEARVNLDFSLLCEALVCRDGLRGVTARTNAESPRLERFRAAVLVGLRRQPNAISVVSRSGATVQEHILL